MKALYKEGHPNKILVIYTKFLNQWPQPKEEVYDMLLEDLEAVYIL